MPRPFETITGENRTIIEHKIGKLHVSMPLKVALKCSRPRRMRKFPVAMRRGWVKLVADTWRANRRVYCQVMQVREEML